MGDAKAYLQQIKLHDARINRNLEELDNLRAMTTKITATWKDDVVSGTGNQDKLGAAVAKIVDLQTEIDKDIDAYIDMKRKVWDLLNGIENPEQLQILYKRYFRYEHWEQIACEMNMTYRNVCYIHGRALQAVADLLEKEKSESIV
jgi:DNA-directed RNA polymerase specialized sigma subunit